MSIRRAIDPRRFTLLPLGGGGPLHAAALADELGIGRIIVPRHPGVLSAAGLLAAPIEHEVSAAFPRPLAGLDLAEVRATLDQLDGRCAGADGAGERRLQRTSPGCYFADVCYIGQSYHLEVPFDPARRQTRSTALTSRFLAAHDRIYGHAPKSPARLVNLRTVHSVAGATRLQRRRGLAAAGRLARSSARRASCCRERRVRRRGRGLRPRGAAAGDRRSPAPPSSSRPTRRRCVTPGWHCRVDAAGNLLLERTGN